MAGARTGPFDVADHLNTPEEVAAYLAAVLEEGDDKLLLVALRNVVKSRGFYQGRTRGRFATRDLVPILLGRRQSAALHSERRSRATGHAAQRDTTGEKRLSGGSGV